MTRVEDLPGAVLKDSERTRFGLGWEYARRRWDFERFKNRCPNTSEEEQDEFLDGFVRFKCSDDKVNQAMLRHIKC